MDALLGGEQSFVWSAAAAAAGLRKQRGRERGDRALEAELRAWKSLGGRGDSAPCLAGLFTCAANSPRALPALPGADPEPGQVGPPSAGCRPDCCNWEDRRAAKLQSEWAAEMDWEVRGDASVSRDLLAALDSQTQEGGQGGTQDEGPRLRKVLDELVTWQSEGSNMFVGDRQQLNNNFKTRPSPCSAQALYTSGMTHLSSPSCLTPQSHYSCLCFY